MSSSDAAQTIAFLYPGMMGASLAWRLHGHQPSYTLLTSLGSRSQATLDRATKSGLQNVSMQEVVGRADIIISILPPSEAVTLAQQIAEALPMSSRSRPPIYVDANAVNPETMARLADVLEPLNVPIVDGSVIGGPAHEGYDPTLYLAADPRWEKELVHTAKVLSGGDPGKGIKVSVLEGGGAGAASALKMCYGGINKGATGLATMLVLAAHAHSPATAQALLTELASSMPGKLEGFGSSIPATIPKAYRFVGEMEEVSAFLHSTLSSPALVEQNPSAAQSAKAIAQTYAGLAATFQRVADELNRIGDPTGYDGKREGEVGVLRDWSERALTTVRGNKAKP